MDFGGLHFVAFGDFAQHQPIGGKALFHGASDPDYTDPLRVPVFGRRPPTPAESHAHTTSVEGRRIWTEMKESVILYDQFRFGKDEDGQKLYQLVYMMTHGRRQDGTPLEQTDYVLIAETLNSCAITTEDLPGFLQLSPKCLILRHSVRAALTRMLALHHAAAAGSRAIAWRATDTSYMGKNKTGKKLSNVVETLLEDISTNGYPPAIQYFFPGMPYRFIESDFPAIGWFKNGECIGEQLVLDPREPPDTLLGDFWVLKFPPKAIMVNIVGRKLGNMCGKSVPKDCIPVTMKLSKAMNITLPFSIKLYADVNNTTTGKTITLKRSAFGLDCALVFTDYFSQGQSFRGAPHFLHLNVAATRRPTSLSPSPGRLSCLMSCFSIHYGPPEMGLTGIASSASSRRPSHPQQTTSRR
jgi:hypothetical protein